MGFLKGLCGLAGEVVGGVVGGGLEVAGKAVGSNFIKEVGQGVYHATVNSAEMLGSLGDSAVTVDTNKLLPLQKQILTNFHNCKRSRISFFIFTVPRFIQQKSEIEPQVKTVFRVQHECCKIFVSRWQNYLRQ